MIGFTEQVAVKQRPTVVNDRYNRETVDWTVVPEVPVDELVSIQPESVTASGAGEFRQQVTKVWRLRTQPGWDLDASLLDRVVWRGEEFTVADIKRWPHPVRVGGVHHAEVRLEAVSG